MLRFLAILLAIYLAYWLIKNILIGLFAPRKPRSGFTQRPPEAPKKKKIINKDEGEYVDFEEVDE